MKINLVISVRNGKVNELSASPENITEQFVDTLRRNVPHFQEFSKEDLDSIISDGFERINGNSAVMTSTAEIPSMDSKAITALITEVESQINAEFDLNSFHKTAQEGFTARV